MEDPIAAASAPDPTPPADPPRRWRNLESRETSRRRRALVIVGLLALATAATLVATVGWLRPVRRPALVLLGDPTAGPSNVAEIPFAEVDRRALADSGAFAPVAGPTPVDARGLAAIEADEVPGVLVVHACARAWAEPSKVDPGRLIVRFSKDGAPPPPGLPAEGASLGDLLDAIAMNKAARQLLILDLLPPPDDPRLGAMIVDLGKLVADEATRAVDANPRLSVLASCDAGQRPLASEALGRSVFGHYVERGLKGDADSSGDGRVTARELAAFVASHVERWASRVLEIRQASRLYEDEDQVDFPLVLVDRRSIRPAALVPEKELAPYPKWLLDGWRERDAARAAGVDREAPRVFAQFEAALLLAERGWRGKVDEARVRSELAGRLERLRDRIAPTRAIAHPRPRSLAQEASFGASPDPEVLKSVREVAAKRAVPTPESKPGEVDAANARLIAEFASSAKVKSDFDLADAVVRVAAEDQAPGRDAIAFLDRLLLARQPRPAYVETLALHRLAGLPASSWSPEAARLALALALRGEAAQARPAALFGPPGPLDDADRLRHEAEFVLASPGYAKPGEVDRRLNQALAATDTAAAVASDVEEARRLLDRAMGTLPVSTALLDLDDLERAWFAAVDAARSLADLLAGPRPLEGLAGRSEALRVRLVPFDPKAIAARVARLARPAAVLGPADLGEAEALLATPLPLADQRAALWRAGIDLERTLAEATLALDAKAGSAEITRASAPSTNSKERRDLVSKALLGLADPDLAGWAELVGFVSDDGRPAEARDRAGRLVSPWLESPRLDDPSTDATRLRRLGEFARLRRWLAGRYAFEARDPDRSDFFAEAAVDFQGAGDPPRPSLAIEATPPSAGLDPDRPEVLVRLGLRAGADPGPVTVEVATADDDWLDVKLGSSGSKATARLAVPFGSGSAEVPLAIALRPESDATRAAIPPGVLVRARWGGRTYHRRIPLLIEPGSRRPRLIFAASPTAPTPAVSEVRIRATQGKASYSIFVQNPGDRDRRFAVELGHRRGPIAGASATLTVKAGETTRVSFGPPPANPGAGVVEVLGPLAIRLVDVDDPSFRIGRTIPVGLASPTDYVRVIWALYTPPGSAGGEKPRLEFRLKAIGPIEGAPCPVELSLPADRIPGLISAGEGTFKAPARLEKLGDEATLFAEDFELDPRGDEWGYVHLAVDGVERALVYRVRFARRGIPTIPSLDVRPAVRLKAGRVALSTAPLKVDVEIDSPPEPGKLKLALGQFTAAGPDDRFRADSETIEDPSRGLIRLNPRGPDGSLSFEATVRDSSITFDVGKVRGRRIIRALLEDEQGDLKASDELPLVLDDRAPSAAKFDSPPKYGQRGGAVSLKATGKVPDSGIKEVAFFAGRPVDGKRPPGVVVVPGKPVGAGRETWSASLPLSDAKLGPLEVSVEFVAGVGPSRFDTATIAVVESIPVEPGKIKGTVKEGERTQPGLEVRLYDEKNAEKGKATTDEEGKFEFANLAPGTYEVVSAKPTPPTKGTAKATVKAGATAEVVVSLFRVL